MLFLAILFLAAMLATLFFLIKGLVNMAGTTTQDLEGDGPSERAIRSNKMMQKRILFQAIAIGIGALILMVASAKG
ncbi:HIG1 domain-containing protein [Sphingomonas sp. RS6]